MTFIKSATVLVLIFFCCWALMDTDHCISFRCTTCWVHICVYGEMVTCGSLTSVATQRFFLVTRTSKVHSLSNFQICDIILFTVATMVCIISPWLIYILKLSFFHKFLKTQIINPLSSYKLISIYFNFFPFSFVLAF